MLLAAVRIPESLLPHRCDVWRRGDIAGLLPLVEKAGGDVFEAEFVECAAEDLAHFGFIPEEETALRLLFFRGAGDIDFAAVVGVGAGDVDFRGHGHGRGSEVLDLFQAESEVFRFQRKLRHVFRT